MPPACQRAGVMQHFAGSHRVASKHTLDFYTGEEVGDVTIVFLMPIRLLRRDNAGATSS